MGFFSGSPDPIVKATAKDSLQFFGLLQAEQQSAFGKSQAALDAVAKAWAPVIASGQIPYGFSPGMDSLLKANIVDLGAAATTNAMAAQQLRDMQQSGGTAVLPAGASAQLEAVTRVAGMESTAQQLRQEKLAGYQAGLQALTAGTEAELGVARGEEATGLAGEATRAGQQALAAGEAEFKESQSTGILSRIGQVAGVAGGIIGDVTSLAGITKGLPQPQTTQQASIQAAQGVTGGFPG